MKHALEVDPIGLGIHTGGGERVGKGMMFPFLPEQLDEYNSAINWGRKRTGAQGGPHVPFWKN